MSVTQSTIVSCCVVTNVLCSAETTPGAGPASPNAVLCMADDAIQNRHMSISEAEDTSLALFSKCWVKHKSTILGSEVHTPELHNL